MLNPLLTGDASTKRTILWREPAGRNAGPPWLGQDIVRTRQWRPFTTVDRRVKVVWGRHEAIHHTYGGLSTKIKMNPNTGKEVTRKRACFSNSIQFSFVALGGAVLCLCWSLVSRCWSRSWLLVLAAGHGDVFLIVFCVFDFRLYVSLPLNLELTLLRTSALT
jgi:hypothetical protein